jgi:heme O synthase-like polyprenyltransferase
MEEAGEVATVVAAPEVGVPMYLAQHGKSVFERIMVALSIVFIIVAIAMIAFGPSGTKKAGWVILVIAAAVGVFGEYRIRRKKKTKSS